MSVSNDIPPQSKTHRITVVETTTDTSSAHPTTEAPRVQDPRQLLAPEILCLVFWQLGFYDFATCTRVCLAWRTMLMESLWPQKQQHFFSLYPLVPLTQPQKLKLVRWLQGHRRTRESQSRSRNLAILQHELVTSEHLRHRQEADHVVALSGPTAYVLNGIKQRFAILRELWIGSIISPQKYDDLLLCLASCHELKTLCFSSGLVARAHKNCDRVLSITYLRLNYVPPPGISTIARIKFLKNLLLLCPHLRSLALSPQRYWRGIIRQILQVSPPTLSTFVFKTRSDTRLPFYNPGLTARSVQKLSITMNNSYLDIFDLADAINSVAETLEILCLDFPYLSDPFQSGDISNLTESFRHCHKLHTVHVQGGAVPDEAIAVLSSIPKLEIACFRMDLPYLPFATAHGFVNFFTKTSAPVKKIGLRNCSPCIDNEVLHSLSGISNLKTLQITDDRRRIDSATYDIQYFEDMVQRIMNSNPELKVIESGQAEGTLHLEADATCPQAPSVCICRLNTDL